MAKVFKKAFILFSILTTLLFTAGTCFSDGAASITNSGETLYYLLTVPPIINVTPSSLNFGLVTTGNNAQMSISVSNTGAGQLVIGTVQSPVAPYSIISDTCSGHGFQQYGGCAITIQFAPTANGVFPGGITIPSNDPVTPNYVVPLSGASQAPIISATPNPLAFGSVGVGNSSTLTTTVQNTGNADLIFSSITPPPAPFSITGGTCNNSTVLTPGQTCTVVAKFSPTNTNTFTYAIGIFSNAFNASNYAVQVTGTGAAVPQISVSPNPDDFGSQTVGTNNSSTLTVQNIGSVALVLGSPALTAPASPYTITSSTCTNGLSIPHLGTCTITVRYAPTAAGTYNTTLLITSNTGGVSGATTTINLTGSAQLGPSSCTASFSASTITSGGSSTLSWTSTNDADGQIPYSCTGNLGSGTLWTASGSQSFAPTASQTCTLTTDNGSGGTSTCTANITVVPTPACSVSFSPGNISVGQSATLSWTSANDADGQIPYSCTGNLGNGTLSGASGSRSFSPAASQTCTLSSQNAAGTVQTCSAVVTVAALPTCSASFSPATVAAGGNSTLTWSSTNDADGRIPYSCTGNLGSGTLGTANGSQSFAPTASQTCTLTADNGSGGTNSCTATVTTAPAPTCTASFSPATVTTDGGGSSLSWSSTNDADGKIPYSCTGNLGSGTLATASGSQVFTPTSTQTCTYTVTNSVGTNATCAATVTLNLGTPTCTVGFNPVTVTTGGSSNLSWSSTHDADGKIPYTCTGNLGSNTLSARSGTQLLTPTSTQTCTLTVDNGSGGTNTCASTVTVVPPPTCSASFSPATVTSGGSSTLSWSSTNDADGQISYSCTGNLSSGTLTAPSGSRAFSPTATQTCTLTAINAAGTSATCTATVTTVPAPTCTASFSPTPVTAGSNSTLTWSSTNDADAHIPYSCTGNLGSGTFNTASGSQSFSPAATQTCTLTVDNGVGGTNTCTATVTTVAVPTCAASFSPASITTGSTSTITWSSANDADGVLQYSCTANLGSGSFSPASGSRSLSPTATQTCTLTVKNSTGTTNTCTAAVTVCAAPTCTASFNPTTITTSGQTSTFSWTSTNDADGQIPYSCTGNLGSGTLSGASGSATASPTSTQTCTLTAQNCAGTTATCSATVSVCGGINLSASSVDFGVVAVGGSETQTIIVSNPGPGTLTLSSISTSAAPFSVVSGGTCTNGMSLPSGNSCTVYVQAAPTSGGTYAGTLSISNNSQCSTQTTTVNLAVIAISSNGYLVGLTLEQSSNNNGYPDDPWQWVWADVGVATGYPKVGWPVAEETLDYTKLMAPPTGYGYRLSNVGGGTLQIYVQRSNASSGHPSQTMRCRYGATFTEGSYSYTNSLGSTVTFTDLVTLPPNSSCAAYVWYGSPTAIAPYFSSRPTGPITGEFATGSGTGSTFIQANGTVHAQIEHPFGFMASIEHPLGLISMYP